MFPNSRYTRPSGAHLTPSSDREHLSSSPNTFAGTQAARSAVTDTRGNGGVWQVAGTKFLSGGAESGRDEQKGIKKEWGVGLAEGPRPAHAVVEPGISSAITRT